MEMMMKNDDEKFIDWFHRAKGIRLNDICPVCSGIGTFYYQNTATWRNHFLEDYPHGLIAGQAFTFGPCYECWGSGSQSQPWPSHREFEKLKYEKNCDNQ